ncbi:unnamed protein product, partial [Clonostachys rhizophaga]
MTYFVAAQCMVSWSDLSILLPTPQARELQIHDGHDEAGGQDAQHDEEVRPQAHLGLELDPVVVDGAAAPLPPPAVLVPLCPLVALLVEVPDLVVVPVPEGVGARSHPAVPAATA